MKKRFLTILLCLLGVLTLTMSGCVACVGSNPANAAKYDASGCTQSQTSLTGKTIYWLGSSVTLGMASCETAVADYIAARNGATCVKDAVSGTTLFGSSSDSYVSRLTNSEYFDTDADIDAFVCQISTNDAKSKNADKWGSATEASKKSMSDFDTETSVGAMEYILAYVRQTWDCPVYFYSNAYFADEGDRSVGDPKGSDYARLVESAKKLAEKWSESGKAVKVIDLYNDDEFNKLTDEDYAFYMYDAIHPYKAGYLEWWTPAVEKILIEDFTA